jgi:putative ABC transport system substrate-binding protein
MVIGQDVFFGSRSEQLAALTVRHAIPAIAADRDFAVAGGLITYSSNTIETAHQYGFYVGRILKGEKPADLPIMQPTKFDLVINMKAAKALGLDIPPTVYARATEVIE